MTKQLKRLSILGVSWLGTWFLLITSPFYPPSTARVALRTLSTLYLPFNYTRPLWHSWHPWMPSGPRHMPRPRHMPMPMPRPMPRPRPMPGVRHGHGPPGMFPGMVNATVPHYSLGKAAAVNVAYHNATKTAYVIGDNVLHVIDVMNPTATRVLTHYILPEGRGTDVKVCGNYVIGVMRNKIQPLRGWLIFFHVYDRRTGWFYQVNQVLVGHAPEMVAHTSDCQTFLSADEGEPGLGPGGYFMNPEGSVTMVTFLDRNLTKSPFVSTLAFHRYDNWAEEYVDKGVRFVFRANEFNNITYSLSQDLEPEYITVSDDNTKAFVSLQENNAIAVIDIHRRSFIEIYPLGAYDWSASYMDTSDQDGGVNRNAWPIWGLFQPDTIKFTTIDGQGYIIGSSEGDSKIYTEAVHGTNFSESTRGINLAPFLSPYVNKTVEEALLDPSKLGRMKFSIIDGRDASGEYMELYTYGARNFGIWRASDMVLVSSSQDDLGYRHFTHMSPIFNGDCHNHLKKPTQEFDSRSDDRGLEPEALEVATVGNKTFIFVGSERMGTISIYSIATRELMLRRPQFEGLHRSGGLSKPWAQLYMERSIGDIDPEEIRYIPKEQSPTGRALLLVVGAVSGTFSMYEILFPPGVDPPLSKPAVPRNGGPPVKPPGGGDGLVPQGGQPAPPKTPAVGGKKPSSATPTKKAPSKAKGTTKAPAKVPNHYKGPVLWFSSSRTNAADMCILFAALVLKYFADLYVL